MSRTLTPVQRVALATAQRLIATDPRYQRGAFLKPSYVMAHCQIESNWDTSVRSADGLGSIGLMQVLPIVARSTGVLGGQIDPAVSVETGMRVIAQNQAYLKHELGRAPSLRQLVMAYNEGAGSVAKGREDTHYWDAWYAAQQLWAFVDQETPAGLQPSAPVADGESAQENPVPVAAPAGTAPADASEPPPADTTGAQETATAEATSSGDGAEMLNAEEAKSLETAPSAGAPAEVVGGLVPASEAVAAATEQMTPAPAGVADAPVLSPGDPGYQGDQR